MGDNEAVSHEWIHKSVHMEITVWECRNCGFSRDMKRGIIPSPDYLVSVDHGHWEKVLTCEEFVLWKVQES